MPRSSGEPISRPFPTPSANDFFAANEETRKLLAGLTVKRMVYVPGRLLNVVV